jgi:hypothetical protein
VEVMEWVGNLDHFSEMKEVWIQMECIPPKWCDCKIFAQITSGLDLLLDVDWASLFKFFYEKVRLKIACRNPSKIPVERLFELDKKLYLVNILVEGVEQEGLSKMGKVGGDDDDQGEDGATDDDDCDDLSDDREMETNNAGGINCYFFHSQRQTSVRGVIPILSHCSLVR